MTKKEKKKMFETYLFGLAQLVNSLESVGTNGGLTAMCALGECMINGDDYQIRIVLSPNVDSWMRDNGIRLSVVEED